MQEFQYPRDVLNELRAAWDTPGWHEPPAEPLPPDAVLQSILEVVYHASFTADERRATRLSVVLCDPGATRGALVFERARIFSVHEIMRLAPAGDIDADPIGIHVDASNRIVIWGMASERSWRHPTFTASSPGSISLGRFSRTVFALTAGRVSSTGAIDEYFINSVFKDVANALVDDFVARRGIMGNAYDPYQLYGSVLIELLRGAAGHGHGATIFVVPHTHARSARVEALFHVKYACKSPALWPNFRETARRLVHDLSIPLEGHETEEESNESPSVSDPREISEWPKRLARLSRVDGGVLITDHYQLLGFGVEVLVAADELRTVTLDDGSKEDIEQYGTRHRSAVRLCHRYHEAVAFVCSQDGGIKCVRYDNGVVKLRK